jgi:rhamnogalacturonan endolyase
LFFGYYFAYGFLVIGLFNLKVRFNDASAQPAHFSTGLIGRENAIARHGIHGLYRFYSIDVESNVLQEGNNTIYLTQSRSSSPFQGVMYDYLRLEGPPDS